MGVQRKKGDGKSPDYINEEPQQQQQKKNIELAIGIADRTMDEVVEDEEEVDELRHHFSPPSTPHDHKYITANYTYDDFNMPWMAVI